MLAAKNLGKRFGSRWIFRGLNFEVAPQERLVILGRNGSGKSTLLKTLVGLLPPSEGSVAHPVGDIRVTVGYAALEMALYPNLTVLEHLEYVARFRGCEARAEELLELIGLAYARSTPASQLSTGMKARLKLALALQPKPQVLLLDEPGASLDEAGRELVERVTDEQAKVGCLIIATNDPRERRFATHELFLDE